MWPAKLRDYCTITWLQLTYLPDYCTIVWLQLSDVTIAILCDYSDLTCMKCIILHDSSNFTYVTTITLTWLLWYFVTKFILHFIQAKSLTLPLIKIMTNTGSFRSNCSSRVENLSLSQKTPASVLQRVLELILCSEKSVKSSLKTSYQRTNFPLSFTC